MPSRGKNESQFIIASSMVAFELIPRGQQMITKTPPLFERAEYIDLNLHPDGKLAELRFVRPSGAAISVTIPVEQLMDLEQDIRLKYRGGKSPSA